ncbi:hypothetical protein [Peristeroidobacter soli]|uniref:hypothetical protein n=1 Tax=Peristeroidobacter soli TaxID=2497877 RepID=UPI00101BEEA2|nr:hypothetical protein [Peristeroidobacter soli]
MKQWTVVLFLLSSVALAEDLKFDASATRAGPDVCAFTNLTLPSDVRVYAAGGYSGRRLGYQIDESGHEATRFDITVNSPLQPVVLLLGAYEPSVWNVGWSKGTRIVAVMISGYHNQAVAGLEESVPVLNSSYDNRGPCGYFYVSGIQSASANYIARKVFQQSVDQVFPGGGDGKILVGDSLSADSELLTSGSRPPESFRDRDAPLAGQAGIDSAVAKGVLRPATPADADAWVIVAPAPTARPGLSKAYVVLAPFTYPSGLLGADAATFFILRGVPRPAGNPGHSAVYDFNSLTCSGQQCPPSHP